MREWGIPLREIADMAVHLPRESATFRALHEDWERTWEVDFLREIEYSLRVLAWQNSGGKAFTRPERVALPWDPEPEGTIQGDRMSFEEADEFLGWSR